MGGIGDSGRRTGFWGFAEHPRTNFIAAFIFAGIALIAPHDLAIFLFIIAAVLAFRSAWEWEPIRSRIPFRIQSPIVRTNATPKVKPTPVALGALDFELYMTEASDRAAKLLGKITKLNTRNARLLTKRGPKVEAAAKKNTRERRRVVAQTARSNQRYALRVGRIEAKYRAEIEAFIANSRGVVENASGDLSGMAATTAELRASTAESRDAFTGYRDAVLAQRAMNLSQALNGAAEASAAVVERLIEDDGKMIEYCDWVAQYVAGRTGTVTNDA